MTTECGREHCDDHERDKHAPVVDGRTGGGQWKIAAGVLLVLALAMPLVWGMREGRSRIDLEERLSMARNEVEAVRVFLGERDLPNAVIALHDIGMRLHRVPGAEDLAFELEARIKGLQEDLEAARESLSQRRSRDGKVARGLGHLLDGDPEQASELFLAMAPDDARAHTLAKLAVILSRLNRAEQAEGEGRVAALELLGKDWALPAVELSRQRAAAAARQATARDRGLRTARAALEREQYDSARAGLRRALGAAGLEGVPAMLEEIRAHGRRERAVRLEAEGRAAAAAALYRTMAIEAEDTTAGRKATELERRLAKERFEADLDAAASRAAAASRFGEAAGLFEALARRSGGDETKDHARRMWARWMRSLAESYRVLGELEASRVVAREAARMGDEGAARLAAEVDALRGRHAAQDRIGRAEAALADGSPAHASRLLEKTTPPADLRRRIDAAAKQAAIEAARVRMDLGQPARAWEALRAAGLSGEAVPADLAVRVSLRTGDVDGALSRLPEDAAVRAATLRATALDVADDAPDLAVRLLRLAREIAGPRADLLADYALALERAMAVAAAPAVWRELRDLVLAKVPLPKKEPPPAKEPAPDESDEEQPPKEGGE